MWQYENTVACPKWAHSDLTCTRCKNVLPWIADWCYTKSFTSNFSLIISAKQCSQFLGMLSLLWWYSIQYISYWLFIAIWYHFFFIIFEITIVICDFMMEFAGRRCRSMTLSLWNFCYIIAMRCHRYVVTTFECNWFTTHANIYRLWMKIRLFHIEQRFRVKSFDIYRLRLWRRMPIVWLVARIAFNWWHFFNQTLVGAQWVSKSATKECLNTQINKFLVCSSAYPCAAMEINQLIAYCKANISTCPSWVFFIRSTPMETTTHIKSLLLSIFICKIEIELKAISVELFVWLCHA